MAVNKRGGEIADRGPSEEEAEDEANAMRVLEPTAPYHERWWLLVTTADRPTLLTRARVC